MFIENNYQVNCLITIKQKYALFLFFLFHPLSHPYSRVDANSRNME